MLLALVVVDTPVEGSLFYFSKSAFQSFLESSAVDRALRSVPVNSGALKSLMLSNIYDCWHHLSSTLTCVQSVLLWGFCQSLRCKRRGSWSNWSNKPLPVCSSVRTRLCRLLVADVVLWWVCGRHWYWRVVAWDGWDVLSQFLYVQHIHCSRTTFQAPIEKLIHITKYYNLKLWFCKG